MTTIDLLPRLFLSLGMVTFQDSEPAWEGMRAQPDNSIGVRVRYPVQLGYRNSSGLFDASPNSCDAFTIEAVPANASGRDPIRITTEPRMRVAGDMYVCDYVASDLPVDEPILLRVAMSGPGSVAREPWIGGSLQPAGDQRRSIVDGRRQVILTSERPVAMEVFEMVYTGDPYAPDAATGASAGIATNDAIPARVPASATESVRPRGRVDVPASAPRPALSICESARLARARNSPATAGLEAQCRASGGTP